MILFIDQGNTRLKAWLAADHQIVASFVCDSPYELLSWYGALAYPGLRHDVSLAAIYVASVCAGESRAALQVALSALNADMAYAEVEPRTLSTIYADPQRLGIDRWLAVLACKDAGASLIIDAGTAFTLDVLGSSNQHEGGYILPGLSMQRDALAQGTARVSFAEPTWASTALGHDTASCVGHGSLLALLGLVSLVAERLQVETGQVPQIVVTGGDAEHFMPWLSHARHRPLLVVEGLARAFNYRLHVD